MNYYYIYKTIQNEICSYHNKCYRTYENIRQCTTFDYFEMFLSVVSPYVMFNQSNYDFFFKYRMAFVVDNMIKSVLKINT